MRPTLSPRQIRALAALCLLLAAIIWGGGFVVVKNSLDLVPPIYMLAIRFSIASLGLCVLFFKKLRHITRRNVFSGAVLGLFLFLAFLFQTVGMQHTTAGKNAFLTTIYVVLVPFLYWPLAKRRPGLHVVVAAVLAVVGIGLLSLGGESGFSLGDGLTLVCGLFFALHIVLVTGFLRDGEQDAVILTLLQLVFAALFSWLTAPLLEPGIPEGVFKPDAIAGMLYLGLLSTMACYLFQNIGQRYVSPSTAALLLSCEAVFGVIFSGIFLHERMSAGMIAGCVLMFVAVVLAETKFSFLPFLRGKDKSGLP